MYSAPAVKIFNKFKFSSAKSCKNFDIASIKSIVSVFSSLLTTFKSHETTTLHFQIVEPCLGTLNDHGNIFFEFV